MKDADAATDDEGLLASLGNGPPVTAGTQQVAGKTGLPSGHALGAVSNDGVPHLDGTVLRTRRSIAQRDAQEAHGIAGNAYIDELTGFQHTRKLRSLDDERKDALGDPLVGDNGEIMHASRRGRRHMHSLPDRLDIDKAVRAGAKHGLTLHAILANFTERNRP